jgi:hypothetical protein
MALRACACSARIEEKRGDFLYETFHVERKRFHFGLGQLGGLSDPGVDFFRSQAASVPRGTLVLETAAIILTTINRTVFPT